MQALGRRSTRVTAAILLLSFIRGLSAHADITDTRAASVNVLGLTGNGSSGAASISSSGRHVIFTSLASDLVADDTNGEPDIFIRDLDVGRTERVSVSSSGEQANSRSLGAMISGNGRFVAFGSYASNLVPGDNNGSWDIFLRDLQAHTTALVSVGIGGEPANGWSGATSISDDGRYVAFDSEASNLVAGDTNGVKDIFVRAMIDAKTERISVGDLGSQANGESTSASISADGQTVAFASNASNLVSNDSNGKWDVFVRDRVIGQTERVSVGNAHVQGTGNSTDPSLDGTGKLVVFTSSSPEFTSADSNSSEQIFLRDRTASETTLVSVNLQGQVGDGRSKTPAISPDGDLVTFASFAPDLFPGDTNNYTDIFVRDLAHRHTTKISVGLMESEALGHSYDPVISEHGHTIAFTSAASNLVVGDANLSFDIFARTD